MCFSDVLAHNLYMGCLSTFSSVLEMLLFVQTISGILDISLLFSQLNFFLHGWKHNKDSLLNIRASLVSMLFSLPISGQELMSYTAYQMGVNPQSNKAEGTTNDGEFG